ncbi:MAG: carbohydrate kinase [Flavobacterium sp. BFFFF2]|nr:MAG: carbohydrate kinase [Flavobacterium sp. BFFFF2]
MTKRPIDIICAGELLIDLIGHQMNVNLSETDRFQRHLGGSPINVAINGSRLGMQTQVAATCGHDGLGAFALKTLSESGVHCQSIRQVESPTSVILISKSTGTPDFTAYRMADSQLILSQLPDDIWHQTRFFHFSCFALSQEPARSTLLEWAQKAIDSGTQLTIDVNYSEAIWPNKEEAIAVLKNVMKWRPFVKMSEDDAQRIFGQTMDESALFSLLHDWGADQVCYTKGAKGVSLSQKGTQPISLPAIPITQIQDATGAGDAFWTGYLHAQIQGLSPQKSVQWAQHIAAIKLQYVGHLPTNIDYEQLMHTFKLSFGNER